MQQQQTPLDIFGLAAIDPVGALAIASCGADIQSYGGRVELTAANLNQVIPVTFQQIPMAGYVEDFTYDLEMPNFAPGNILAGQQIQAQALRPGVDLKIQVNQGWGPMNYVMNSELERIQQLIRCVNGYDGACCNWLRGKFVWTWQSFAMLAVLRRQLAEGEDPYILTFSAKIRTTTAEAMTLNQRYNRVSALDELGQLGSLNAHQVGVLKRRFEAR